MTSRLMLYLTSIFLFICLQGQSSKKVFKSFQIDGPLLAKAYVLGDVSALPNNIKKAHNKLNLGHLFTPSGLHFQSLIFLLYFFMWPLRLWAPAYTKLLITLISLPLLFCDGYLAIKRIIWLRLAFQLHRLSKYDFGLFNIFLMVFTLDIFVGTFSQNPWSFFYSFIFLGTIFSNAKLSSIPLSLFITQFFLAALTQSPFNPLSSFIGIIISSFFVIIFPFFITALFLPIDNFLLVYEKTILFLAKFSSVGGQYFPGPLAILIILVLSSTLSYKKHILWLLVFYSSPLFNLDYKDFRKKRPYNLEYISSKKEINTIKRTRKGYKITYKDQGLCRYKLYHLFYEIKCQ
ncbi:MAG: hypothetical protein OEY33_08190 [Bdellovibrionales bacterium]|jgi:hypothetical protein|nr:hypothetical protein [Bdellovibrionales bacterium]